MPRLRDRQRQVPGGFKLDLEPIGYRSPAFASFDVIVDDLLRVINANPDKAAKYQWPTNRTQIADWVDEHNARLCASYGWADFITPDDGIRGSHEYRPDLWPLWARTMHSLKTDADTGVGDTVERVIGTDNAAALKAFYMKAFGRVCGCDGRKSTWNAAYPYK